MRKLLLISAVAMFAALSAPSLAPAKAVYKSCSGGFNSDGSAGSFYKGIRAKKISCSSARSITKAWVKYEAMTDGANPTAKVTIKGYKCTGKAHSAPDSDGSLSVVCVKGSKAVRFSGHP